MAAAEGEGKDAVALVLAEESLQRAERAQALALAEERGAVAEDAAALSVFVGTWNLAGEVSVVSYVA